VPVHTLTPRDLREGIGTLDQQPLPPDVAAALKSGARLRIDAGLDEVVRVSVTAPTSAYNGRTAKGRARRS
jgi:hypothetical protein